MQGRIVFRAGGRRENGRHLRETLANRIAAREETADLLVRAGEVEAAVADAGLEDVAGWSWVTDSLAEALVSDRSPAPELHSMVRSLQIPESLTTSVPESFSYYGLHPLDFADTPPGGDELAVIGIRSIGVTLAAVVVASARAKGQRATRISVRPEGHPFDRKLEFTEASRRFIEQALARQATFVIVDEGPGMSGSTFLAVIEAMVRSGVSRDRLRVVGTAPLNPRALCAPRAAERWVGVHFTAVAPARRLPAAGARAVRAGDWRREALGEERNWPFVWPLTERTKLRSSDGSTLWKHEGLGRHGAAAFARARALADAELGPRPTRAGGGFVAYPWISGRRLTPDAIDRVTLNELARYCARRAELFPVGDVDLRAQLEMAQTNLDAIGVRARIDLTVRRAVIADGRMGHQEWIRDRTGALWKVDACAHGDDHFFPGPTDIAWDLAGLVVELDLGQAATDALLTRYQALTGDRIKARIRSWVAAYAAFRACLCDVAMGWVTATPEAARLRASRAKYRDWALAPR